MIETVAVLKKLLAAQKQKNEGQVISSEAVFEGLHKKYEKSDYMSKLL